MSVNSKMTAIADEVRMLSGVTGTMGLDAMATNVRNANNEVSTQVDIIEEIMSALDDKLINGTSSVSAVSEGDFTYTTSPSDPGTYDFVLTSDELHSSSRRIIILFISGDSDYSEVWKVFYRTSADDELKEYLGSKSYIYHGMRTEITENTVTVVATSIASDTFTKFWFVAI